jgi:hypothetical protein
MPEFVLKSPSLDIVLLEGAADKRLKSIAA